MNQPYYTKIVKFNEKLGKLSIELPAPFKLINPYKGKEGNLVRKISNSFYKIYFSDNIKRRLILGSSPARRGTVITGIPFEDMNRLQELTGYYIKNYHVSKASSDFLYEVIDNYGGTEQFYKHFYLGFVFPLGLSKINSRGNEVNCNYYENKQVEQLLMPFIIKSIQLQINFGIDTSICYCIGCGDNYKELKKINNNFQFFRKIIPLEHPRFITQYNPKDRKKYLKKYLNALNMP